MKRYRVIGQNGESRIYEATSPGAAIKLAAADGIVAVRLEAMG